MAVVANDSLWYSKFSRNEELHAPTPLDKHKLNASCSKLLTGTTLRFTILHIALHEADFTGVSAAKLVFKENVATTSLELVLQN